MRPSTKLRRSGGGILPTCRCGYRTAPAHRQGCRHLLRPADDPWPLRVGIDDSRLSRRGVGHGGRAGRVPRTRSRRRASVSRLRSPTGRHQVCRPRHQLTAWIRAVARVRTPRMRRHDSREDGRREWLRQLDVYCHDSCVASIWRHNSCIPTPSRHIWSHESLDETTARRLRRRDASRPLASESPSPLRAGFAIGQRTLRRRGHPSAGAGRPPSLARSDRAPLAWRSLLWPLSLGRRSCGQRRGVHRPPRPTTAHRVDTARSDRGALRRTVSATRGHRPSVQSLVVRASSPARRERLPARPPAALPCRHIRSG